MVVPAHVNSFLASGLVPSAKGIASRNGEKRKMSTQQAPYTDKAVRASKRQALLVI
jgi:hypothetical protein